MASLIRTQLEASALLREHGLAERGWRFEYDNARTRGGQCRHRDRVISMSRNLVPKWTDQQVQDTLIHELAHALVGPGNGHGAVWKRQMIALGAKPERCHSNETVEGRYVAMCDHCGVEAHRAHRMSPAMRQGRHLHAACRKPVRWVDTGPARV